MVYGPEDEQKFTKWFMESFKSETYLSKEIMKRLNNVFKDVPKRNKASIDFSVTEINGQMTFTTTIEGFVFLGVLSQCILDIMADHISSNMKSEITKKAKESVDAFLKQNHKICTCGYYNDAKFHFCALCGAKLV